MTTETLQCLDGDVEMSQCEGPVKYRMPLSGTGRSFARCDKHWDERLRRQQEISRNYPDSPTPPEWFDPAYAGERWDDDY